MRDEERGTRGLPAGRVDGLDAPRRVAEGVDAIPDQARPHPDDGTASRAGDPPSPNEADNAGDAPVDEDGQEKLPGRDDGQRDPEGAARSTSSEGRRLVTGGTMSEQEQHDKTAAQSVQATQHGPSVQHIQHDPKDPQDRSGARAMFIELRKLPDGSAEYAELRNQLV
ncbi:RNA polymerase subunit sigma-70, partial [Streptomyces kaempferi]